MTESVRLRATYRYADASGRDAAIGAALGALEQSAVRCAITLGSTVVVDLEIPLFGDHDFAFLRMFERGAIESQLLPQAS